ncbi:PilT/PilU family type 4a pilus ATPase [Acidiferrimicrobium sp. IK]|uniref:PilT/PilU family type 4a pilus ATPase n=1 Tax=Acidiferrimicrobium sp. IK TaxID=2871700 RepID=UPI002915CD0B|nr:PilT/PilU family type 4a pilus ATPase [Acidiferrimicrobium sp. IK]MCU4184833.1 PilT/PilU family type 4a pilus ATPase [Acidiferrimicrobium sp. IK]
MASASRQLGEYLVEHKVISRSQLEAALSRESSTGVPFSKIVIAERLVSERDLVGAVAHQLGFRFWDPVTMPIQPMVQGLLPEPIARAHRVVVIDIVDDKLLVAIGDPHDQEALNAVKEATGWDALPALVSPADLIRAIEVEYGPGPEAASSGAPKSDEGDEISGGRLHLNSLLAEMMALDASDLHLSAGRPPSVRVHGAIRPLEGHEPMIGSDLREMVYGVLAQRQRERFEAEHELDTSHTVPGLGRFRLNVFQQKDSVGAVLRAIPFKIRPLAELGIPATVEQFAKLPRGLVLVTGPTGSGKSTTLASLIDMINSSTPSHIMTVEDPIEFLHDHKRSVVNQREVGVDTHSFAEALKHVLRQDPDVILVGEMRDLETISTALTAAETGHLVFGTLHTQDAPQSVDRVIDVFPSHQQQQIRVQLASALQGVVTQQLIPVARGGGRAVATEVLVVTPAIRNLIREGKVHQIYSSMQAGGQYGMQTMDQSLAQLVRDGVVSLSAALERCANPADIHRLVGSGR